MRTRWLLVILQTVVTVGLLAFFFRDPTFRAHAAEVIRQANFTWLWIGVALAGVENLIGVLRWRIFLRMLRIELPFWKSVQICLVALFCNTFLLGAAGGDLVRAAYLIRRGAGKTNALMSVILDRMSGLAALVIYTITFAALHWEWLQQSTQVMVLLKAVAAYQLGCLVLIVASLVLTARGFTERLPKWAPFPEFVRTFGHGYAQVVHQWRLSLRAMGLSLFMLAGYVGVFFAAAHAFNVRLTFGEMATLVPIVDVISALPISIGGMGVREVIFVTLLGQLAAVPAALAASVSMVGYLLNVSWGLVGAACLPLFKGIVRDARHATDDVSKAG